jgi:hypothetical protein
MRSRRVITVLLVCAACCLASWVPTEARTPPGSPDSQNGTPATAKPWLGRWECKTADYIVRVEIGATMASVALFTHGDKFIIYNGGLAYRVDEKGHIVLNVDDKSFSPRVKGTITPDAADTLALDIQDFRSPDASMQLRVSAFACALSREKPKKK